MDFDIRFLSFYVVQMEGAENSTTKHYKHFQTLNAEEYEAHAIKDFLDGELAKIAKRKVEHHPKSETTPTKIGRFIVEPGHELSSNPNYNLFNRLRNCDDKEEFQAESEALIRLYTETSAVRDGAFLVAGAKPKKFYDDLFLFIMKCDFEPKVAAISDTQSLIRNVEMAITTKNMKSIQYPYMIEDGLLEEAEVKIHQASHARYFEDFLKYVEYGEAMPTLLKNQVKTLVEDHFEEIFADNAEQLQQFEHEMEIWEGSEEREIQERLSTEQVIEATQQIVELAPTTEFKMKVGETSVRGPLADFGESVHLAKIDNKYVLLLEADSITFDKNVSPIEFHKPDHIEQIIQKIIDKTKFQE